MPRIRRSIAARDLAQIADWNGVLAGAQPGTSRTAAPGGVRSLPGGAVGGPDSRDQHVELRQVHNLHQCADEREFTGAAVGRQQSSLAAVCLRPDAAVCRKLRGRRPCYLAVWVADDGREQDGDLWPMPRTTEMPGHGIVRVRAEAFGIAGSRRAIEAELSRVLSGGAASAACRAFVCNPGRNYGRPFLDLPDASRTIETGKKRGR